MQKMKVLIVDDETDASEILSLRLKRRNIESDSASTGEQALEYLKTNKVDVVLLDVKMPGMDGIEVLGHIKRDHAGVEVIMISGHANLEVAADCMDIGAFDYQLKPVDLDTICHKIEDAYKQKQLTQAS